MIDPQNAIGKPLVVLVDGEKRQIGTITHAVIKSGGLYVAAQLDLAKEES